MDPDGHIICANARQRPTGAKWKRKEKGEQKKDDDQQNYHERNDEGELAN